MGIIVGWMLFTAAGHDTIKIMYNTLDHAGDKVSTRIAQDIPIETEFEIPTKKVPDMKRNFYLIECQKVGFPLKQCEQLWDQDDQKPMVPQVFGVKIEHIDQPEKDQ